MKQTQAKQPKTKRVLLVGSEKGGVGKTPWCISFVDYVRAQRGGRVAAFDADGSVGGLVKMLGSRDDVGKLLEHQDPLSGIGFYNIRSEERVQLLDAIASNESLVVHDLAGGSLVDLMRIVDAGDSVSALLDAFDEHGYRVTIVQPITSVIAATQSVARYLEVFGNRADHVVVKNRWAGKNDRDFPFWTGFVDGSGTSRGGKTREHLEEVGGIEIEFPAMADLAFAKTDEKNLRPSIAESHISLTITERAQVAAFRRAFARSIEPARGLLGL